jgi:hypothetical protein
VADGFWTEKAAWPQRYAIRLLVGDDRRTSEQLVSTWLGRDKAIALAVAMHVRRHGGHIGVHDVEVEQLGPARDDGEGRPEATPGDLVDHTELR